MLLKLKKGKILLTVIFSIVFLTPGLLTLSDTLRADGENPENCPCSEREYIPGDNQNRTSLAPGYCSSIGGSHSYEYISDVSFVINPGNTITITVNIYILNPSGCTYGNPCPVYDDSPEYINAWIDWDGNQNWEEDERVLDAALTGYTDINYQGTMTCCNLVTIPPNAVDSTWMRVNLGWEVDPNDPCEYHWQWGDVVDTEVILSGGTIIDTGYRPSSDGFAFYNYEYDLIVGNIVGHCLGMSIASLYYYRNNINLPNPGTECNPDGENKPPWSCDTRKLIEYFHWHSTVVGATEALVDLLLTTVVNKDEYVTEQLDLLAKELSSNGPQVLILPAIGAGHAVVAYKMNIMEDSAGVWIYDPNWGDDDTYKLEFVRQGNYYHMNSYYGMPYEIFSVFTNTIIDFPFICIACCPTDLNITDPEGLTLSKHYSEIPGGIYFEMDINNDTHKDDFIIIPNIKNGNYSISVIPEDNATENDTYTLIGGSLNNLTVFAENITIGDIPENPYVFRSELTGWFIEDQFSAIVNDTNDNGLWDYLKITVSVNVTEDGMYMIKGGLFDKNNISINYDENNTYLFAGYNEVDLIFGGYKISAHKQNGPYYLKGVTLVNGTNKLVDSMAHAYTTVYYNYTDFEYLVLSTNNFSDYIIDSDGDTLYDYLVIAAEVITSEDGHCVSIARLVDNNGVEINWTTNTTWFYSGIPKVVELRYDWNEINKNGMQGPYHFKDLFIYHTGDVTLSDYTVHAYITAPIVYVDDDYTSSTLGWQVDHYNVILDGIDAVAENGTVHVYDGVYYENVVVNKSAHLIGEDKYTTIIDGGGIGNVVTIASDWVDISGFTLQNGGNNYGVYIYDSRNIIITGNTIAYNDCGIYLFDSSNNTITGNHIENNGANAINIDYYSNNNKIYHNNFINNTNQAIDYGTNTWDNGYPSGGNYWSDYTGIDSNGDGIGETPYNIGGGGNQDRYPFVDPLIFLGLSQGWNLITAPFNNTWTAETLGQNISECTVVIMYNSSSQTFLTHVVGTPHDDFPILDGVGYFIYVTVDSVFVIRDVPIMSVNVTIEEDWNLIGWCHETTTIAESLGQAINGTTVVIMFNSPTQTFLTHVVGTPHDNFTIERGMGLFIYTDEASYWHGEG